VTVKATSLLSLLAIWVAMIPAVIASPGAWWALIFAFLASGAVGIGAWRSLGISRLMAVTAVWAATGVAIAAHTDAAWISIFSFVSTGAIVYSAMRRTAVLLGLGIAAAWLTTGTVIAAADDAGPTWVSIFAFLTAGAVANKRRGQVAGLAAIVWWAAAGAIMLATDGWYWLAVLAFLFSSASLGFGDGGFRIPRHFEWDLFRGDDEGEAVR
jgi:hypothetical protein